MKTIHTDVYTYNELSNDARAKAREWYVEKVETFDFLFEYLNEYAIELLHEAGITDCSDATVRYSLSCSQGDGAMVDIPFSKILIDGKPHTLTVKHEGRYSHYNSKFITLVNEDGEEVDSKDFDEKIYIPLCRKLEKAGYEYIDCAQSDEQVSENLILNEYTFTSDGKRFG